MGLFMQLKEFLKAVEALHGLLAEESLQMVLTDPSAVKKSFTEASLCSLLKEAAPRASVAMDLASKCILRMHLLAKAYKA
eukprot:6492055-Amphidinium_carterae.1